MRALTHVVLSSADASAGGGAPKPLTTSQMIGPEGHLAWACRLITADQAVELAAGWRLLPVSFPANQFWRVVSCLAWMKVQDRHHALLDAQAARALNPAFWPAHLAEAHVLCEMGEMNKTAQDFRDFWNRERRHPQATRMELFEPALMAAERALALHPEAEVWNDLGAIYFAAGDHPAAKAAFLAALDRNPDQRHALANYAVTLSALGEIDNLKEFLQRKPLPVALPVCLGPVVTPPLEFWRQPRALYEERRLAVFSQIWWRALPPMMTPADESAP